MIRVFRMISLSLLFSGALTGLLPQKALPFQRDTKMNEEFLTAVTQGQIEKVKAMLQTDPNLASTKDQKGVSAILKAIYYGRKDVAALLLSRGLELSVFEAAATGQTARVRELIKKDPSAANAFSVDGFMPLGLAAFFGHRETVESLLALGADVNAVSRESMRVTPLHSAVAARNVPIARVLIAHGANVNARQAEMGFVPLHEAALNGQIELAMLLIEHGAEINAKTTDGKTPLVFAIEGKQGAMVAYLKERGASQ